MNKMKSLSAFCQLLNFFYDFFPIFLSIQQQPSNDDVQAPVSIKWYTET